MATITKGKTFTNGELVTPQKLHELVDLGTVSGIVNADISAIAAIADTKLAQITTAGKVLPAAVAGTAVVTTDPRLSDARTPTSHTHDDRYYTEMEMNTLLAGKQASGSYAPATGIAPSAITGTAVITTDPRLSDARTPTSHTHDDRYYTETEMNTLLAGKQASGSYAASSHNHDASNITSGTLANARTTAASANTANAIVARDASGDFSANTVNVNYLNINGPLEIQRHNAGQAALIDLKTESSDDFTFRFISWPTINQIVSGDSTRNDALPLEIFAGDKPVLLQLGSGHTGIGTSSPNARLSVTLGDIVDDARVNITSLGNVGIIDAVANSNHSVNRWLSLNKSGGYVSIGNGSPSYTLHVHGSIAGIGAYNNVSDAREKENINYNFEHGLETIKQLKPVYFDYKENGPKNNLGFIAQDIQQVLPGLVSSFQKTTDANLEQRFAIKETNLIAVLVKAVQELSARVAALEAK